MRISARIPVIRRRCGALIGRPALIPSETPPPPPDTNGSHIDPADPDFSDPGVCSAVPSRLLQRDDERGGQEKVPLQLPAPLKLVLSTFGPPTVGYDTRGIGRAAAKHVDFNFNLVGILGNNKKKKNPPRPPNLLPHIFII